MVDKWTRLLCVALTGSLLGCASAGGTARVADLHTRMADLKQQLQQEKRRVEDLNNQVFLLQDRIDSQRVAASRARATLARSHKAKSRLRQVVKAPRPAARRPALPRESSADIARRKARRRLPVVKLRRRHRYAKRTYRGRRSRRLAHRTKPGKRIVLRLTGAPAVPRTTGRPSSGRKPLRKPLGPVPQVNHRLAVVPLPGGRTPPVAAVSDGVVAQYRAARALFSRKKYVEAAVAFSRFARIHPRHAHADNAQYWLAECFYRRGKVAKAAWVLRKLLKKYPSGNKAPSALLKLAHCVRRLGRRAKAKKIFAQVVQLYPGTREAALAAAHLRRR